MGWTTFVLEFELRAVFCGAERGQAQQSLGVGYTQSKNCFKLLWNDIKFNGTENDVHWRVRGQHLVSIVTAQQQPQP